MSVIDSKDFARFEKMPPALAARLIRYYQHEERKTPLPEKREGKRVITRKIARNIARNAMKENGECHINSFLSYYWREYFISALANTRIKHRKTRR